MTTEIFLILKYPYIDNIKSKNIEKSKAMKESFEKMQIVRPLLFHFHSVPFIDVFRKVKLRFFSMGFKLQNSVLYTKIIHMQIKFQVIERKSASFFVKKSDDTIY